MSQPTERKVDGKKHRRSPVGSILVSLVATGAILLLVAMVFFSFSQSPTVIGNYLVVGPECDAQAAVRAENSYRSAKGRGQAGLVQFAGIRFYRNVPWGPSEQQAPVGP